MVHPGVLPIHVLVVDDEQNIRQLCAEVAAQSGMKVTAVATAIAALDVLDNSAVDILLTDLAHNLLADFHHRALVGTRFESYGLKRIVRRRRSTAVTVP